MREELAVAEKLLDRIGIELFRSEAHVLGAEIVDHESNMAVAIAERVRLLAAVIDSELQFEIDAAVAEIDEREIVELEPVRYSEPEGPAVEIDRTGFVENANHR